MPVLVCKPSVWLKLKTTKIWYGLWCLYCLQSIICVGLIAELLTLISINIFPPALKICYSLCWFVILSSNEDIAPWWLVPWKPHNILYRLISYCFKIALNNFIDIAYYRWPCTKLVELFIPSTRSPQAANFSTPVSPNLWWFSWLHPMHSDNVGSHQEKPYK